MRDERLSSCRFFCIPLKEKDMRTVLLMIALIVAVSCGLEEVGRKPHAGSGEIWTGPGMNAGKDDPSRTIIYVTGMDYPDGYDWRADQEKGNVRCSLVVFADGLPMMKVPVGDAYETSPDPDMHRMIGGHLYTDYSTDSTTVIKKDGKEIFRYRGREMICGMAADGNDVYSLAHPCDGAGFTFRKNGRIVLQRHQGYSFGNLYEAGDSVCFAFCEPGPSSADSLDRYYHVVNGKVSQVALREDVRKVWDMAFHKGKICYLASVAGMPFPVLFISGRMQALKMPLYSRMLTCRIISGKDALCVEGLYERPGKPLTSGIWMEDGQSCLFADGMTVSSICVDVNGVCCVLDGSSAGRSGMICRFGESFDMPEGYSPSYGSSVKVADGTLHAGLSSQTGGRPVVWKDGILDTLDINGYIVTISTSRDQSSQLRILD